MPALTTAMPRGAKRAARWSVQRWSWSRLAVAPSVIESPITTTLRALVGASTSMPARNRRAVVLLAPLSAWAWLWSPSAIQLVCLPSQWNVCTGIGPGTKTLTCSACRSAVASGSGSLSRSCPGPISTPGWPSKLSGCGVSPARAATLAAPIRSG